MVGVPESWRSLPKYAKVLAILLGISAFVRPSFVDVQLEVEFLDRVRFVSIWKNDHLLGTARVRLVRHLLFLDVNLKAEFL